ncbi:MAG: cation:proton antiporter [Nitrososphaeria archaeon]
MAQTTLTLLYELGLIIIIASLASELFKKIKLPGLIGAILVGLFLGGPGGIGLVTDLNLVNTLALIGSILILFTTGLEFDVESFWKAGKAAFLLTTVGVVMSIIIGYVLGKYFGLNSIQSLLLGAIIAPSGTSVIAHTLAVNDKVHTRTGSTLLTACIIDDVEGVLLLTIALGIAVSGTANYIEVSRIVLLSTFFVLASIYLGGKILPQIIYRASRIFSDEIFFAILFGFGLILAFIASNFGLAAITGAFIMGAIIPYKKIGEKIGYRLFMMKELFSTIFFTSIGLSVNPYTIAEEGFRILMILFLAILFRFLGGIIGGGVSKLRGKNLASMALGLSIRAEMSLIIAREAFIEGILDNTFLSITTAVVVATIFVILPIFTTMCKQID